jgi:uncharacterized RDD family membrane protein YckC
MACWLYEGMLLFGVVFISGYLFGTLSQTRHALHNRHGLQAFLFLVFAIYFTWFWSKGQTLAMKTWHIKIVDLAGQPVSQARAFLIAPLTGDGTDATPPFRSRRFIAWLDPHLGALESFPNS